MNSIELENFKAFKNKTTLNIDNKNLLCFGENGAGKSSIYEALKIVFFEDRILEPFNRFVTQEEISSARENYLETTYKHKGSLSNYSINVNNTTYAEYDTSGYQVCMFSLSDKDKRDSLKVLDILNALYFNCVEKILIQDFEQIKADLERNINETIILFKEDFIIEFEVFEENNEKVDYLINISDPRRNLKTSNSIRHYFNEAKINIIELILQFNYILLKKLDDKKKIIILDDFITSLDSSNRIFITKFLFEKFNDFQIILLTHNLSYYNLCIYLINQIYKKSDYWKFANVYEIDSKHICFFKASNLTADLKSQLSLLTNDSRQSEIDGLGNDVRRKFESLLYEFSKLLSIGAFEESSKIIERLTSNDEIFLKRNGQKLLKSDDLIKEIIDVLDDINQNNLNQRIRNKINEFKFSDLTIIKEVIRDLKLYQKTAMHPMSHGAHRGGPIIIKELQESIVLITKLEDLLKNFINNNTSAT